MADADLEKIRQARLQELQRQGGGGGGPSGGDQQDQQRAAQEEARKSMISQILTPEAADRLGRIRMVKAERAEDLENRLIMLARSGRLPGRVSDAQLVDLIEAVNENTKKAEPSIKFQRRKGAYDSDDDFDF